MSDTETEAAAPVAHVHEVENPEPASPDEYVPDPNVQAYVTTITLALAHTTEQGPYDVVGQVTKVLETLGIRGVVVGVASVELRGDGGLIGL